MEESVSTWVTSVSHSITAPSLIWVVEKNTPDGGKGGQDEEQLRFVHLEISQDFKKHSSLG